ncbi:DUF2339 domain-containing protein, partial [Methylophaga sp.]|uniref:DUF2339 domain-containing protein n=1 Tax=Methylophaga sp. TaxID=2024840 RepID=UPI003F69BDFB
TDFAATTPYQRPRWQQHMIDNWMTWLGGISVGLAGIFMVKYSINMGLLGPKAQITMAILTGIALHVAADWLRRKNGGSDPVFASLAGGASITLYAALLAALHVYHLIDPRWVFGALAIVSLVTMVLALMHGPMLAMIGLVGAYVVPLLVNTGSGNIFAAMIYSLIISSAGLLLIRYVSKSWLWWGVVAGAMGWWLLSLTSSQPEDFRGIYLAIFAWMLLAIPAFDWFLQGKQKLTFSQTDNKTIHTAIGMISMNQLLMTLIVLGWAASIYIQGLGAIHFGQWAPLVVICFAASQRQSLWALPWLSLGVQWLAWLLLAFHVQWEFTSYPNIGLTAEQQHSFLIYTGLMTLLYSALSGWQWLRLGFSHARSSLALLSPLIWLALAYLCVNGIAQSLSWSIATLLAGLVYGFFAALRLERDKSDEMVLWLTLSTHLAYTLAVAIYFREASLSLALSAQLLSLTWLMKRYQLPWLEWMIKAAVAAVILRLTFNPWLLQYGSDIHWTIWTYGGATLFALLASRQCQAGSNLRAWLEAATLHLLVLTLGTELRYWLYDGNVFAHDYSLVEAAINASVWAALALTYQYRAKVSQGLTTLYQICSKILLLMALVSFGIAATIHNPWWSGDAISSTPVFNILLLAYGAPIIWALLVAYYHQPQFRQLALRFAGLALMLFVALEIRQLWQGGNLSLDKFTGDGELYTYSVVWMLMAIAGVLLGTQWRIKELYKAGMGLLSLVIAKIFLVDMSGLDGLWRVAAFMGLGLSLLGLAWLYKRMQGGVQPAD